MLYTTLNKICACNPCAEGWATLLHSLHKTQADDEPLSFEVILNSNGLDDALWATCSAPEHDREWRLFAVFCARSCQPADADPRSIAVIDVAERFARGEALEDELSAAWSAAVAAADAARLAAEAGAAGEAAGAAARAAARAAAWSAWEAAAGAAAGSAAESAAESAARAAARAAAGSAAGAAARSAARAAQEAEFLRIIREKN